MQLYYIRHGEPTYEPDMLTSRGKRQAEELANVLSRIGLDEIYASTSKRALETAEPTAKRLGLSVTPLDWCNEKYAYEEFSCIDKADGRRKWLYEIERVKRTFVSPEFEGRAARWYERAPFSEKRFKAGFGRIQESGFAFLRSLGYAYDDSIRAYHVLNRSDKKVALFAHEGVGMALLSTLLGIPYPHFCTHFSLGFCGFAVLSFDGASPVLPRLVHLDSGTAASS